jgi:hypothetical protein
MKTATWISESGYIVYLGDKRNAPFILEKIDSDIGALADTVQAVGQDGESVYDVNLEAQVINITGSTIARGHYTKAAKAVYDDNIALLRQAFNPKGFGMLYYNNESGGQRIRCRPVASPTFAQDNEICAKFDIELRAEKSHWESAAEYISRIGELQKGFRIPFRYPVCFGRYNQISKIYNVTMMDIHPIVEITTTAQLINIINETTGEHIEVQHPIRAEEKLIIDCENADVSLYNTTGERLKDVSNWITLDSDFIALKPGENILRIENDVPGETPHAIMKWRIPIMGV